MGSSKETQFITDKKNDEHAHGHTGCQAQYIDQRIFFSLEQVAKGNFEEVSKHSFSYF